MDGAVVLTEGRPMVARVVLSGAHRGPDRVAAIRRVNQRRAVVPPRLVTDAKGITGPVGEKCRPTTLHPVALAHFSTSGPCRDEPRTEGLFVGVA